MRQQRCDLLSHDAKIGGLTGTQAQDLLQYGTEIGLFMIRVVGMVVADTFPEIAMCFVEALTQYPGAGLQIGAEIVAQRVKGALLRRRPVRRNLRHPDLIDLHRPDIDGVVAVLADMATSKRPAFHVEQDDKYRRWNSVSPGCRLQASFDGGAVTGVGRPGGP